MEHPSLNIGSFGLMLQSENQKINLTTLTNEFKLDVYINDDETLILQKQDGIVTAVSDSYIQICNNKKKDKHDRPNGFVKIQYSKNKVNSVNELEIAGRKTLSRPPIGPIPIGVWCYSCKNIGPKFHKENCKDPIESNLKLTLLGFIECINSKSKKAKKYEKEIVDIKDKLDQILNTYKDKNDILEEIRKRHDIHNIFYSYKPNQNEWPLLLIDLSLMRKSLGFKVKKDKSFFSNCAIVSYNFPNEDKSVSIRIYESSLIHLVSCPWNKQDFYNIIIDKINDTKALGDTGQYNIDLDNTNLINVFTYFNLIPLDKSLDLKEIYNYLWPVDENNNPSLSNNSPKRIYTKVYVNTKKEIDHDYLVCNNMYYRYTIDYRTDLSTPKILLKLLPCEVQDNIPKVCKPYKFSIFIFTSGKIQSTFSFCRDNDEEDKKVCDSFFIDKTLEEQFILAEEEATKIIDFIYCILKPIENNILLDKPPTTEKDTIDTTVAGIVPYKKKDKLKIGEEVDIFDDDSMNWESRGNVINIDNNNVIVDTDNNGQLETFTQQDLRAVKQSVMGLSKDPEPYKFDGKCKDNNSFVPFGGTQARDNLYYPYCAKKTKDKYNLYIDQILQGFPLDEDDEIKFKIDHDEPYDKFSGIIEDSNTTQIGNMIEFIDPETGEELEGIIISKEKSRNRGLDNVMEYKIQIGNDIDNVKTITGKDFALKYRQDRRWEGIQGNELEQKIKLINCAKKLGLAQSPYISKSLNSRLQNNILSEIHNLLPDHPQREYCGRKTSILTPKTLINFTKRPYCALLVPKNSQRVLLYATPNNQYFIDETLLIMELDFDDIQSVFILDGYLHKDKNILRYYPIDCIYHNNKLKFPYINDKQENSRLYYTIYISKYLDNNNHKRNIKIENPESYISPYISPLNKLLNQYDTPSPFNEYIINRSIINDTYELLEESSLSEIIFIAQKGNSNYMKWKKQLKTPIVLESIKKTGMDEYIFGIGEKTIKPIGDTPINIKSIKKLLNKRTNLILRFDLNFSSEGKLDMKNPLSLNIDPIADQRDLLSYERTQLIVDAMIYPILEKMFMDSSKWEIYNPEHIKLITDEYDSGIKPLIIE